MWSWETEKLEALARRGLEDEDRVEGSVLPSVFSNQDNVYGGSKEYSDQRKKLKLLRIVQDIRSRPRRYFLGGPCHQCDVGLGLSRLISNMRH